MAKNPKRDILTRVKALDDARSQEKLRTRVQGSFTSQEYAESVGISQITARGRLCKLVQSGKLRRVKVPVCDSLGNVVQRHGYVLANGAK